MSMEYDAVQVYKKASLSVHSISCFLSSHLHHSHSFTLFCAFPNIQYSNIVGYVFTTSIFKMYSRGYVLTLGLLQALPFSHAVPAPQ